MFKYIRTIAWLLIVTTSLPSCEKYLDKSPDIGISDETVYSRFLSFQGFLDQMYRRNPEYIDRYEWRGDQYSISDEAATTFLNDPGTQALPINKGLFIQQGSREFGWSSGLSNSDVSDNRPVLEMAFINLRVANLCIQNIGKLQDAGDGDKKYLLGQAYFFRAWNYFQVIRRWGGMPLFDKAYDSNDDLDFPRLSYHESTRWLVSDLDKAFELLPDSWPAIQKGRVTKAAALALKSMALLYSASPNMCPELSYAGYDTKICDTAAKAAYTAINYIQSNGQYSLMDGSTVENYSKIFYNPDLSASAEAIWYRPNGIVGDFALGSNLGPNSIAPGSVHYATPTQNIVDMFEMKNGLPITDPASGYDPQNPYVDRDPRFYYSVLYNYAPWTRENNGNKHLLQLWQYDSYQNKASSDWGYQADVRWRGPSPYLIRKFWPEGYNKVEKKYNMYVPSVYIRVTQLYLDFAEAANEAYGPTTPVPGTGISALDAINTLRRRSGVVDVPAKFTSSKEVFRDKIRNERTVELCFEQQRWHDIRRWRIGNVLHHIYNVEITRIGDGKFSFRYYEDEGRNRVFENKHYWYPIPKLYVDMLYNLEQNPGW